jgi:hypothetical protein
MKVSIPKEWFKRQQWRDELIRRQRERELERRLEEEAAIDEDTKKTLGWTDAELEDFKSWQVSERWEIEKMAQKIPVVKRRPRSFALSSLMIRGCRERHTASRLAGMACSPIGGGSDSGGGSGSDGGDSDSSGDIPKPRLQLHSYPVTQSKTEQYHNSLSPWHFCPG